MVKYLEKIIPLEDCEKITQLVMNLMCNRPEMVEYSAYSAPKSTGVRTDTISECDIWLYVLKEQIEDIVGFKIKPVNTYCREYVNGSSLPKHTDRKDIGVTLTVCIENPTGVEWQICSKDYDDSVTCKDIKVTDGLIIYNSNELEHWRDELICGEDEYVFMMFLHWIKEEE